MLTLVVEGNELSYYNTEGDRNSVVSHASCRMDVTQLEQPYCESEMLEIATVGL